jgi:hypothetical protein
VPLPADAEADVLAWLAADMAVLDIGYVGSEKWSDLATPSAAGQLPAMVREADELLAEARRVYPALPPTLYASGVSFGGIPALAFSKSHPDVRGVYLTSPLCSIPAERSNWLQSEWMPTYRAPYGSLINRVQGDVGVRGCAERLSDGPPVFIAYNSGDPVLGERGVAELKAALKANPGRALGDVSDVKSHAIPLDTMIRQVRTAKAWFERNGS